MKPKQPITTIAVQHKNPTLKDAVAAILAPQMENVQFVHVTKLKDLPEGCDPIATMGLPGVPREDRTLNVLAFSTDYSDDKETMAARWAIVNSETSTVADICEVLAKPKRFTIVPQTVASKALVKFHQLRGDAAETDDLSEKYDLAIEQRDVALSVSALPRR